MKTLIIYVILIASVLACMSKASTSEMNAEVQKTIELKIYKNGEYYLNDSQVIYHSIIRKIDSLGKLGYNSAEILVRTEKEAKVSETIKIMELANKNNKKVKLGTAIN